MEKIDVSKTLDPKGTVTFALGTVGGTIGAGVFLEMAKRSSDQTVTTAVVKITNVSGPTSVSGPVTTTSTQTTTTTAQGLPDLPGIVSIGTALGASSAVMGGIVAAVIIKAITKGKGKAGGWSILFGALGGLAVGAGVGSVLGNFGLTPWQGAELGGCVGVIAAIIDSVVF